MYTSNVDKDMCHSLHLRNTWREANLCYISYLISLFYQQPVAKPCRFLIIFLIMSAICFQVLPCDVLTRVSQYVPEVVTYIQKMIDNGFAWVFCLSSIYEHSNFSSSAVYLRSIVKAAKTLQPGNFLLWSCIVFIKEEHAVEFSFLPDLFMFQGGVALCPVSVCSHFRNKLMILP